MTRLNTALIASAGLVLASAAAAHAETPNLQLTTGLDYSVGKYGGSQDTSVYYLPLTAGLRSDVWHVEVTAPFLSIHGPGNFIPGANIIVRGGSGATSTRSGFGDVILGGGWTVLKESPQTPQIELAASTKFPTARDNLGTGKQDYFAQATISKAVADQLTLFGVGGYQWLGSPSAYRLKSGPTASAGFTYKPSSSLATGASLDYRAASYAGLPDQVSVSPFLYYTVNKGLALSGYATAGLSKSAPRVGAGFRVTLTP